MLSLPPAVRVFVATEPVDLRKSFDALALVVEHVLKQDPLSGHLFVFVGRRRHLVRILFWDRSGFALFSKRLERGRYAIPAAPAGQPCLPIEAAELVLLLEGINLAGATRRPRWNLTSS